MWLKRRWVGLVLAAIVVFAVRSLSGDEFYYGGFHAHEVLEKCPDLSDSLRFNLVFMFNLGSENIDSLADNSLKGVAEQYDSSSSPTIWSKQSYYTIWETHRFPESRKGFTYNGGNSVYDPEAHNGDGDSAVFFASPSSPGMVQTGPDYLQYGLGDWDPYRVDFNLKFSGDRSVPTEEVCRIMVVTGDSVVAESVLVVGDFDTIGYDEFQLQYYYPANTLKSTHFKVYWYGVDTLFIDYVEVYDNDGYELMDGWHDQDILSYVQQPWVDPSVIHRWYMRDEPASIDCYMPYAHIDSLLKDSLPNIPGAQFYCHYYDTSRVHEYLIRTDPVEYMIDIYPFHADDSPSNYQDRMDLLTQALDQNKRKAESLNKDFWLAIQGHLMGYEKTDTSCPQGYGETVYNGITYCYSLRDPTPNEVRFQTFLALCYSADAVMNYRIPYYNPPGYLETGLYDIYAEEDSEKITDKWKEIKDFTGPRVEKFGPIIADLEWQGACQGDEVRNFHFRDGNPCYLYYGNPLCQYGFFSSSQDRLIPGYLMMVSRNFEYPYSFTTNFNIDNDNWDSLNIYGIYSDSIEGRVRKGGNYTFSPTLYPGEGKLFNFIDFCQYGHITADMVWGGTIHVVQTVTVDPGVTLRILPGTEIYFPQSESLIVKGTLEAIACSDDVSIEFVPEQSCDTSGAWPGIMVDPGGRVKMKHAYVRNADVGLTFYLAAGDTVSDCRIYNSRTCGVKVFGCDSVRFWNNTVYKDSALDIPADNGIYLNDIRSQISCVAGNTVKFYKNGIYATNCSTLLVNNKIHSGDVGIRVKNCEHMYMGNNYVTGSFDDCYIYCDSSKTVINECKLYGSSYCGVKYVNEYEGGKMRWTELFGTACNGCKTVYHHSGVAPDLGTVDDYGNNWFEKRTYGYHVWTYLEDRGVGTLGSGGHGQVPSGTLKAEKNYWGDTVAYDVHFHGNVDYIPYLTKEPGWTPRGPLTSKITIESNLPKEFRLSQNYPNPFNPHTLIEYDLPKESHVTIKIYNILGQRVTTLIDGEKPAGRYKITWDGKDDSGVKVSTGVYFYRIKAGEFQKTKKLLMIK